MKMWHILICALLVVSACSPLTIYHRAGVPVADVERTLLQCQVAALKDAPIAKQRVQSPPIFVPPRRICNGSGVCVVRPGYFDDGIVEVFDANRELRIRLERQCMADKGFAPTQITRCPLGTARDLERSQTRILPSLSTQSCAVVYPDGSWQILEQS